MKTKTTAAAASGKKSASAPKAAVTKAAATKPVTKDLAKRQTAKTPAVRQEAKVPATQSNSREAMLARVESVRTAQRAEGQFDCFGRAAQGYCDQGGCAFHSECLSVSGLLHSL